MLRNWLVSFLLFPISAFSCVVLGDGAPVRVPHSFSVHVANELGPVRGLALEVTEFDPYLYRQLTGEPEPRTLRQSEALTSEAATRKATTVIATATTDKDGNAQLSVAGTGDFRISPKYPIPTGAAIPESSVVNIFIDPYKPNLDATDSVTMTWPETMLHARRLRGRVTVNKEPLGLNPIVMHTALTYEPVAEAKTLADGSFDVPKLGPGLYFVQFVSAHPNSPMDVSGDIPVYLSSDSPADTLEIDATFSDCGLEYRLGEKKYVPKEPRKP